MPGQVPVRDAALGCHGRGGGRGRCAARWRHGLDAHRGPAGGALPLGIMLGWTIGLARQRAELLAWQKVHGALVLARPRSAAWRGGAGCTAWRLVAPLHRTSRVRSELVPQLRCRARTREGRREGSRVEVVSRAGESLPLRRGLWWSGCAVLALVALVTVLWEAGDVVVLGDVVPRRWAVTAGLFAVGAALLSASAMVSRGASAAFGGLRRAATGVVTVALLGAASVCCVGVGLVDATSNWAVLQPGSAQGCRVVVEERSFLLLGSGVVHVLPPGERRPRPVASYVADDGYRPVTVGTWSLRWDEETAHLRLWGTEHQPVFDGDVSVPCAAG